jgi:hypothetical protein
MVNEAYEAGTLILSPNLYYAPQGGGMDVIGRQSVRRAYLFYLDPQKWDSYGDLARVATASFKGDTMVEIDGRHYWGLSNYGEEKMQEVGRNLKPDDTVLYMVPTQWTEAEYLTVRELRQRTDRWWGEAQSGKREAQSGKREAGSAKRGAGSGKGKARTADDTQ